VVEHENTPWNAQFDGPGIFLRFAEIRFAAQSATPERGGASRRGSQVDQLSAEATSPDQFPAVFRLKHKVPFGADSACFTGLILSTLQAIHMLQESLKTEAKPGAVTPDVLCTSTHPALRRLAKAVEERNADGETVAYTRMHHRHARSHTRK
jgi:uncharacterized protein (DUF885 family)